MSIYIFLIVILFIFFMSVLVFLPLFNFSLYFFEWDFLVLKFGLYFNSILFSLTLLLVTLSVLLFSTYYLNGELDFNYYYFVLMIFVGSMFFLIFSSSVFTLLMMWDLLGISSFFLVLFYNNWDSCSGAMNTALTNRLGDFFLFVFFSSSIFSSYYFLSMSYFSILVVLFLLLASFTKSAQFPFSSWLPKAMSAPTPVSSLVHSSTLVTAGLVLLMNFSEMIFSGGLIMIILLTGVFTMFFSSVAALVEEDLKKVVALSTLSQMGFSMLTLGLGLTFISFLHLISHALFKSCLFMQIGYLIHCSFGQQDGRGYNSMGNLPKFMQIQMLVTLFCLCGLLFSSGSVSKDYILEFFFYNIYVLFFSLMFFISVFFTFVYSYRLWKSLFLNFSFSIMYLSNSLIMNFLSLFLVIFSVIFIWWLNLNMLMIPMIFLYLDFFVPLMYVGLMILFFFLILKFILKEFIYKFLVDYFVNSLIGYNKNLKFFDLFLNNINSKGFTFFSFEGYLLGNYMKSFNFSSLVFIMMFLFFVL